MRGWTRCSWIGLSFPPSSTSCPQQPLWMSWLPSQCSKCSSTTLSLFLKKRSTMMPKKAPKTILSPMTAKAIGHLPSKFPNMIGRASSEHAMKIATRVPKVMWSLVKRSPATTEIPHCGTTPTKEPNNGACFFFFSKIDAIFPSKKERMK